MFGEKRLGALAAIGGGALWVLSEVVEVSFGEGHAHLSLTFVAFMLVAFGVFALHRTQAEAAGALSLGSAACVAVSQVIFAGFCLVEMSLPPGESAMTSGGALGAFYWGGSLLSLVGLVVFGVSVVRAGVMPRWTGVALIAVNGAYILIIAVSAPAWAGALANAVLAFALLRMGVAAWSQAQREAVPQP